MAGTISVVRASVRVLPLLALMMAANSSARDAMALPTRASAADRSR